MTKAELISNIATSTGYDKASISIIVESFMSQVKATVAGGETVYLRGFGCFSSKKRAAKKARDIAQKRTVHVPEHKAPVFKAYDEFTEYVRTGKPMEK